MVDGFSAPRLALSQEHRPELLRLVDVGGAGGLQPKWLAHSDRILPVLFEPNPIEAEKVRSTLSKTFDQGLVIETGLSNLVGPKNLNITRYWGCTSLRQPNPNVLGKYRIGPAFDVVSTKEVNCTRYDILYQEGSVPSPDAIKIDVQGFEYEVLQGFGGLLQSCIAIELETHIYPIYREQKLLHHIVAFLADFGFVLRGLAQVPNFDGDVVELDAWFTKDIRAWRSFSPMELEKFQLICKVWNLVDYARIDPNAPHTQLVAAGT
jgi:FkbM family methyltransferase